MTGLGSVASLLLLVVCFLAFQLVTGDVASKVNNAFAKYQKLLKQNGNQPQLANRFNWMVMYSLEGKTTQTVTKLLPTEDQWKQANDWFGDKCLSLVSSPMAGDPSKPLEEMESHHKFAFKIYDLGPSNYEVKQWYHEDLKEYWDVMKKFKEKMTTNACPVGEDLTKRKVELLVSLLPAFKNFYNIWDKYVLETLPTSMELFCGKDGLLTKLPNKFIEHMITSMSNENANGFPEEFASPDKPDKTLKTYLANICSHVPDVLSAKPEWLKPEQFPNYNTTIITVPREMKWFVKNVFNYDSMNNEIDVKLRMDGTVTVGYRFVIDWLINDFKEYRNGNDKGPYHHVLQKTCLLLSILDLKPSDCTSNTKECIKDTYHDVKSYAAHMNLWDVGIGSAIGLIVGGLAGWFIRGGPGLSAAPPTGNSTNKPQIHIFSTDNPAFVLYVIIAVLVILVLSLTVVIVVLYRRSNREKSKKDLEKSKRDRSSGNKTSLAQTSTKSSNKSRKQLTPTSATSTKSPYLQSVQQGGKTPNKTNANATDASKSQSTNSAGNEISFRFSSTKSPITSKAAPTSKRAGSNR